MDVCWILAGLGVMAALAVWIARTVAEANRLREDAERRASEAADQLARDRQRRETEAQRAERDEALRRQRKLARRQQRELAPITPMDWDADVRTYLLAQEEAARKTAAASRSALQRLLDLAFGPVAAELIATAFNWLRRLFGLG